MEVIVIEHAGFCFGVERAVDLAFKTIKEDPKQLPIFTLGPIIHNSQVVQQLDESGILAKNDIKEIDKGTIIVRSHGMTTQELREAQDKGLRIIDATCPLVKRSHDLVLRLNKEGYSIIILGNKDHPEIRGIVSLLKNGYFIVETSEEMDAVPFLKRAAIIAQTTQTISALKRLVQTVLPKTDELRVFNTICDATLIRQEEATALASKVDCIIVVGGHNSSNTTKLAKSCREVNPRTFHIEGISEIDPIWVKGAKVVGVAAGASTPNWLIQDVVKCLKSI